MTQTQKRQIIGAGGGGKGGGGGSARAPVESPDSLRSRQYARVIDVISEGEIGGLVDGLKSIYLDETPIQNADGSFNFNGVVADGRVGTQSQTYVPGFPAVESEIAVGTEVKYSASVTRQITNSNVDAIRVTISIPQLTSQDTSTGDLNGTSVSLAIDLQTNGGGFIEQIVDSISGKTTSRYQRSYRIDLTGTGPWDIRVRRLTADSTTTTLVNKTWWDSYTEVIDAKLSYPNSALVALQVDASQFRAIPSRGYDIYGLKVRVPTNYNPESREYSGIWDGTFKLAWSDNPAWCFYDLLTSERYGLGAFIDVDQIDKWSLYDIGRHCDELVPDGFGGYEPRFTCNLYLQTREEAYKVISNFASIFAGLTFWGSGSITAVADKPADPGMQFTPANVIEGGFSYSGSSRRARHTVALVSWNDPDDFFRQKIEYVPDEDGIAKYGIVESQVFAFGCTSRGQAHRYGKRILLTERLCTEVETHRCGLDSVFCAPGDVYQTVDPSRSGVRLGGRLVAATTAAVTIDSPVTIEAGKTYSLFCILPDGSLEERAVTTGSGSTSSLTVSPAFSQAPQADSVWVLSASDLVPETWQIVGITEVEKGQVEITGLAYRADKFDAIESDIVLEPLPTSTLSTVPAAPTNLAAAESLYQSGTQVLARLSVGWDHTDGMRWEVSWRIADGNWTVLPLSDVADLQIDNVVPGVYSLRVVAVNALGRRSTPTTMDIEVFGKTLAPVDVSGFSVIKSAGLALASWAAHPDLDVQVGGNIVVRHSPLTSGATWNDSVILDVFPGASTSGTLPLMTGTYLAKAIDSSGNWSANAAAFTATEGMVTGFVTVATSTQHPAFTGAKTSTAVVGGALQIDSALTIDAWTAPIDSAGYIDALGGIASAGTYLFSSTMDLGTVAVRRFVSTIAAQQFDAMDLIDLRGFVDDWESVDGTVVSDCDATLYIRTTNDDPAGTPTWGPWTPFFVGDFECRAAQFKLDLSSGSSTHNIKISTLSVVAKIPA